MRITSVIASLFLALGLMCAPAPTQAQVAVAVSVRIGPPVLPVYVQPICPGPGYMWIPGYWAYGPYGYFWVPGTWVEPPEVGLLWTPGYWAFDEGFYVWHAGYWGPVVGFYGGIDYGFGYPGVGFYGGYWRGGTYYYNRAVTNVNVTVVHNTYNTRVVNNYTTVSRVSFNGGPGGTTARPTRREMDAVRDQHVRMTSEQVQHQQAAATNRTLLASVNHGRPDIAATSRPGEFRRGAASTPAPTRTPTPTPTRPSINPTRPEERNRTEVSPREPSSSPRAPMNTVPMNPKLEQKQRQDMDRLRQRQDVERQKVQQQQMREQEKLSRQRPDSQRMSEVQGRQQQQQERMNQRQAQQTQKLQQRQQKEMEKEQRKNERPSHQH